MRVVVGELVGLNVPCFVKTDVTSIGESFV